ncbi:MAG TPA: Asp-tRNA(Asn)/Glu-tRNA(Gln) amidotransferase subunit GatB [bacterium]|nr:Asp-tRNA(Asn)/Glu-tRNA(Gln) amidotransferase subunit GatB [bacterium]
MGYETIIGLEVHVELLTESKMFCGCANRFGAEPNTLTCPVCLGFPGTLPVVNEAAVTLGIKTALGLGCRINRRNHFDRKNYFYPDMPKNYQISQYEQPLAVAGRLEIKGTGPAAARRIGIHRIHLEEDVGKLIHPEGRDYSLVDFNRAGVPLMEIVTEPDLRSPDEAYEFLSVLKAVLQYLNVSDCNMEEGSLRCDANISLRPAGQEKLGTKVEVKNLNSFRAVRLALRYEEERQQELLTSGRNGELVQETRLWDDKSGRTQPMRSKEEAQDYRYFPEPDLLPLRLEESFIETVRGQIVELPQEKARRFESDFGIPAYDAEVITADRALADFFEAAARLHPEPKTVSNWIMTEVLSILKDSNRKIGQLALTPETLAGIIGMVAGGRITAATGKEVLRRAIETGRDPESIVSEQNLGQISDSDTLAELARATLAANPKSVEDYRRGKTNAIGFLVGQVMRQTKGKANPRLVQELLAGMLAEKTS